MHWSSVSNASQLASMPLCQRSIAQPCVAAKTAPNAISEASVMMHMGAPGSGYSSGVVLYRASFTETAGTAALNFLVHHVDVTGIQYKSSVSSHKDS